MIICGFLGCKHRKDKEDSFDSFNTTAVGIRFLTSIYLLLMRELIMNLDREFLGRSIMIFPKFSVFGYYEYRLDLGLVIFLWLKSIHQTPFGARAEYML
jgi:hypothetical protein